MKIKNVGLLILTLILVSNANAKIMPPPSEPPGGLMGASTAFVYFHENNLTDLGSQLWVGRVRQLLTTQLEAKVRQATGDWNGVATFNFPNNIVQGVTAN